MTPETVISLDGRTRGLKKEERRGAGNNRGETEGTNEGGGRVEGEEEEKGGEIRKGRGRAKYYKNKRVGRGKIDYVRIKKKKLSMYRPILALSLFMYFLSTFAKKNTCIYHTNIYIRTYTLRPALKKQTQKM